MITDIISPSLLSALVLYSTPILLAGLAAVFTQQANILNIAVEGMMLVAAFFSVWIGDLTQSWELALLGAIIAGLVMSIIFAYVSLVLRADFIVAGIGINLLASGVTVFLLERIYNNEGSVSPIPFPEIWRLQLPADWQTIPGVSLLYAAFNSQSIIVFLGIALVIVSHVVLYRTKVGVHIRATGENPEAVEAAGMSPTTLKVIAVLISGLCAGLGGAQLTMATLNQFVRDMTNGVGFIGLAAMIFGAATPVGTLVASVIFGLANAVGDRVSVVVANFPSQFVLMLPYIVTLVALTLAMIRRLRSRPA